MTSSFAIAQEYVPGEVIVKVRGQSAQASTGQVMGKLKSSMNLKASFPRMNVHHFALKKGQSVESAIQEISQDPQVEYVEPNYILKKADSEELNVNVDSSLAMSREAVINASQYQSFAQIRAPVQLPEAWTNMVLLSVQVNRPIVAIIDSGVDVTHSVFVETGAIWVNNHEVANNGVDDDGNGYVDDSNGWNFVSESKNPVDDDGHGTHVAGIVLGAGQDIFANTLEPAKVQIMPLKFLDGNGSGSTSNAIRAIYYAVNNGANVINNSWGGSGYSQALLDAMSYAYDHHVTVVSAAGNASSNNDSIAMYPANYDVPNNISVAATNDYDNLASFSNYGASTVHIGSPGVSILSTVPGDAYYYMSGTSMAAPFVAGMAALVLREAPQLTGYQVKNLLFNSSEQLNQLSGRVVTSARINSLDLILAAQSEANVASYQPPYQKSRAPASASSDGSTTAGGGCGTVSTTIASQMLGSQSSGWTGKGSGGSPITGFIVGLLFSVPMMVWLALRKKAPTEQRRKHERFVMHSTVKVKAGDRELVGQVNTVSLGGISFDADAMLDKGGIVSMQITSPDGKEQIQVEGQVVWNENNHSYGVQFAETKEGVKSMIQNWTRKLVKAN